MMRFLTLTGHGLRRARKHLGTVFLVYLASLVPALLVLSLISADLAPELDRSLFARELLTGEGFGAWMDFQRAEGADLQPIAAVFFGRLLLVILLQILVAAGLVEVLLQRAGEDERPFLSGIGRHGFRFVRSALVFGLWVVVALAVTSPIRLAFEAGGDRLALWGVLAHGLVVFLLFALLDLAYDFSRISAAAHGEGRMFVGFFKAQRFVFRHLPVLLPLYVLFALVLVGLQIAAVLGRPEWKVDTPGEVLGWVLVQQAVFFVVAFLRTAFWGAEVVYFQGLGEPHWCGPKEAKKAVRAAETKEPRDTTPPESAPSPGPAAEQVAEPTAVPGREPSAQRPEGPEPQPDRKDKSEIGEETQVLRPAPAEPQPHGAGDLDVAIPEPDREEEGKEERGEKTPAKAREKSLDETLEEVLGDLEESEDKPGGHE